MGDLISRSALLEEFEWLKENTGTYNHAALDEHIQRIKNAPTVDAEPVRHGKWKYYSPKSTLNGFHQCSVCLHFVFDSPAKEFERYKYCPNCGAKMDAEVRDA